MSHCKSNLTSQQFFQGLEQGKPRNEDTFRNDPPGTRDVLCLHRPIKPLPIVNLPVPDSQVVLGHECCRWLAILYLLPNPLHRAHVDHHFLVWVGTLQHAPIKLLKEEEAAFPGKSLKGTPGSMDRKMTSALLMYNFWTLGPLFLKCSFNKTWFLFLCAVLMFLVFVEAIDWNNSP